MDPFCGGSGGGSGGDQHVSSDSQRRMKRYHRHTAHQIQRLESTFKECPHPDEKQRLQLSKDLGLAPRQIKFWFQNRRTQMKAQHERADNCALRAENDKIRIENIAIREALKNVICPSCGGPPLGQDSYYDEQELRMENDRLKEELDRVSSMTAKYVGRPISLLPPAHPAHLSALDLSMGCLGGQMIGGPSHDMDLLTGSSSSVIQTLPFQSTSISNLDKAVMVDVATNALEELLRLLQTNEPLWVKSHTDGRDILNLDNYRRVFPRPNDHLRNPNLRTEASRDSCFVIMNSSALVDSFIDANKWAELFPTIVTTTKTVDVVSPGIMGTRSGSLQLIYGELQVLSPLVPVREFCLLRYCQQVEQGLWAIVDVSYDFPRHNQFAFQGRSHRLPSGCLIQDKANGCSQVSWIEHVEIEDKTPIHQFYRNLVHNGMAFGATRWLTTLQRMCERYAYQTSTSTRDLGGVIPSLDGKQKIMQLAQRMVRNFCTSISTSSSHRWITLSGMNEVGVRLTVQKSTDPGHPNGVVLSAATTIWLPTSPQNVFNFFRDERSRPQWDVLSNGNPVQEVTRIANGRHPGNCISVLRAFNTSQNNMLILQENCTDESGSLVVYCPVDLPAINLAMSGEDTTYIPLLPSGFTISPDGQATGDHGGGVSTSYGGRENKGGSIITVAFQILVSSLPSAKLNMESVTTVNNLITTTVHKIKSFLSSPIA